MRIESGVVILVLASACRLMHPPGAQIEAQPADSGASCSAARADTAPPILSRIVPDSVSLAMIEAGAPTSVLLEGCGFDDVGNTVAFGSQMLRNVPSSDGKTRIRFIVPAQMQSVSEVPPMRTQRATYLVHVVDANGRSNDRPLTLY